MNKGAEIAINSLQQHERGAMLQAFQNRRKAVIANLVFAYAIAIEKCQCMMSFQNEMAVTPTETPQPTWQ